MLDSQHRLKQGSKQEEKEVVPRESKHGKNTQRKLVEEEGNVTDEGEEEKKGKVVLQSEKGRKEQEDEEKGVKEQNITKRKVKVVKEATAMESGTQPEPQDIGECNPFCNSTAEEEEEVEVEEEEEPVDYSDNSTDDIDIEYGESAKYDNDDDDCNEIVATSRSLNANWDNSKLRSLNANSDNAELRSFNSNSDNAELRKRNPILAEDS